MRRKDIGIAIIGCGNMGRQHARALSAIPGVRVEVCVSRRMEAAAALAAEIGAPTAATDISVALGNPRVHAVVIATPHHLHRPMCEEAARAGKHMLVEKPLAVSVADCSAIVRAVRNSGVTCMVGYKLRYSPTVRRARELLPEPDLIVGQMVDDRWDDLFWGQDPVQGGANVLSQGGHMADLIMFLAGGPPLLVTASASTLTHPNHPCIDHLCACLEFDGGRMASWVQADSGASALSSKFSLRLHGKGNTCIDVVDRLKRATYRIGDRIEEMVRPAEEGLSLQDLHFIECLRNGREPECNATAGMLATLVIHTAIRAAKLGRALPVEWPRECEYDSQQERGST